MPIPLVLAHPHADGNLIGHHKLRILRVNQQAEYTPQSWSRSERPSQSITSRVWKRSSNSTTADVTRRAEVTSTRSDAATARDAHPRTRPSRDSQSETWSSLPPSVCWTVREELERRSDQQQVIFLMLQSSRTTPSQRCTSSSSTASLAPFTARLSGTTRGMP